ncbi:MAG: aspartyl protease family protein [Nitrospirae bacterium]|nr:aspartyl protease family protein [Nitrospirota bacterium]
MNGKKSVVPLSKSVLGLAAFAILLLWLAPAMADIFEWTDDQGGTHFSDNPGTIPEKYRKNAKKIGGEEAPKKEQSAAPSVKPGLRSKRYVVRFHGEGGNVKYVKVRVGSESPTWMLLDTGATYCRLSRPLAKAAGIDFGASTPLVFLGTASGVIGEPLVKVDRVEMEGAEVRDIYATVEAPIGSGAETAAVPAFDPDRVNGILGMSFLDHFRVTVDSERSQLILEPRSGLDARDSRGAHSKRWWQSQFRTAKKNTDHAERQLGRLKERTRAEDYQDLKKRLEITIDFFQRELSELERKASHANVPQEWRK